VAGLASTSANAAMVISMRALGTYTTTAGAGFAPLGAGDTASSVVATNGKILALGVFATVTQGTAPSDVNGYPAFSSLGGRVVSELAPFTPVAGPGGGVRGNVIGNFADKSVKGSGFNAGALADLDGDGDIDVGNTDANAANPTGWALWRAATGSGEEGPGSTDLSGTNIYGNKPIGGSADPANAPSGNGFDYFLGTVRFIVTDAAQANSVVGFEPRPLSGNTTWFENAQRILTDNGDGTTAVSYQGGTTGTAFSVGSGVTLVGGGGGVVPEPASLGLAGLAGLSLLARRGKKD